LLLQSNIQSQDHDDQEMNVKYLLSKKNEIGRDFDKESPLQNELLSQQGAEKSLKAILMCHTSHF